MKNELKEITLEWLRKWLFPDFTNKLTWTITIFGISAAAVPAEFRITFFNWIIAVFNISSLAPLELPSISDRNESWPYILIVFALIHNFGYKVLLTFGIDRDRSKENREQDKELYKKLSALLPTGGPTIQLVKNHDFGGNFFKSAIDPIDDFIYPWKGEEYSFNNIYVEKEKEKLLKSAEDFRGKVASYTTLTGGSYLTIYPRHVDPDVNIPDYIRDQISELNDLASKFYQDHQQFVLFCKKKI